MFNEIINREPSIRLLKTIERKHANLRKLHPRSRKDRVSLLKELKAELEMSVMPALKSASELASLELWLSDYLPHGLVFETKTFRLQIRPLTTGYSPDLYSRFREIVAFELHDFIQEHGFLEIRNCRHCDGFFIWERSDQRYCTDACRSASHRSKAGTRRVRAPKRASAKRP